MMASFQTNYHALSCTEDSETPPESEVIYEIGPESKKARWNHVQDLDVFFRRVYYFHQNKGWICIVADTALNFLFFILIIICSTFAANCVNYRSSGHSLFLNSTYERIIEFNDLFIPPSVCIKNLGKFSWLYISIAVIIVLCMLFRAVYNLFGYKEIKDFYDHVLKITDELENAPWHEVQCRLREVQRDLHMCVHKEDLTELDIYHRILRKENYMVAMVNKNVLPLKHNIKWIGEWLYLTDYLRFFIELILFSLPSSPFNSVWLLKEDHKKTSTRIEIANKLKRNSQILGFVNLMLFPVTFPFYLLYNVSSYADLIRFEPSVLCTRKWSAYAKLSLRHFNELDHELKARLNRAYSASAQYMNSFPSYITIVFARYIGRFSGSVALFFFIWGAVDDYFFHVSYMFIIVCGTTVITAFCMKLTSGMNTVYIPKTLLTRAIADIHYSPDSWKEKAHTADVRNQFRQLFQLRLTAIIEEIFSPLLTSFILMISIPNRSLDIVDFFHNFTIQVIGVGDVCSFALLDVNRHGNPNWLCETQSTADQCHQAELGKTELSLLHFTMMNPTWVPPASSAVFLNNLRGKMQQDVSSPEGENPLYNSLGTLRTLGDRYVPIADGMTKSFRQMRTSESQDDVSMMPKACSSISHGERMTGGGVGLSEGPLYSTQAGLFTSFQGSDVENQLNNPVEYRAAEISLNTLYVHEVHDKNIRNLRQQRTAQSLEEGNPELVVQPSTTERQPLL